ncbi:hypothetical protein GGR51DRAFT_527235 [Nemania sp. FL0031]|nr:hypothetical protein GGR51DRAFT_527235 [Nemania sp. FL0031]
MGFSLPLSLLLSPRGATGAMAIWGTAQFNPPAVSIYVRDRGVPSGSSSTLVTAPAGSACSVTITSAAIKSQRALF